MLSVSRTYLEMPVIIHEFSAQAVPEDQLYEVTQVRVWQARKARCY